MNKTQKIILWSFGLIIAGLTYITGMSMNDWAGNAFVALVLPVLIIGTIAYITCADTKKG